MVSVDASVSSYLVNYGTEFDSAGEPGATTAQAIPPSGSATLSISSDAIATSTATSIDMLLGVDQISVSGTPLTLSQQALTLGNRTTRSVGGSPVVWYSAVTPPAGSSSWSILGTSLLMSESDHDAALGVWKYVGPYTVGPGGLLSNERYPTATGSYVAGTPTPSPVVAQGAGGSMAGFGFGLVEAVGTALDSYAQWTASASASVDPTTKSVTISITGVQTYLGFSGLRIVNGNAVLAQSLQTPDSPALPISARSFTCTAQAPMGNVPYSCQLSSDTGAPSGTFSGRFFGPGGKTFAGTVSMLGFAFGSNSDGVTGGVIVRAP